MRNYLRDFEVDACVLEGDHFTDDVVGELIVNELPDIFDYLVYEPFLLVRAATFEAGLHHAAALLVSGNLETVEDDGFVYWLFVSWAHEHLQACLDHVVAVNIHREVQHVVLNGLREHETSLRVQRIQLVEELLQWPRAVLVSRDLYEVVLDVHENPVQLVRLGDLNELLTKVIGELINHKDVEEVDQYIQKLFTKVEVASLSLLVDFLLESPAALMFFRESKSILNENANNYDYEKKTVVFTWFVTTVPLRSVLLVDDS